MSFRVMDRAFELLSGGTGPFHVQLTGGEPTLVTELLERAAELTAKLAREGRKGTLAVQTNATLLDAVLVKDFAKWKVEVGVSLDGSPDVNDKVRGGSGLILNGLALLSEANIPFNVTTVVSEVNCPSLYELPIFLSTYKTLRGIGLDLLVRKGTGCLGAPQYKELKKAIKKMAQTIGMINSMRTRPIAFRELELVKNSFLKGDRAHFCEAHKGRSFAVDPTGVLYPCGQAAFDTTLSMGTVFERDFPKIDLRGYNLKGPYCEGCLLQGKCPGECPSRLYFNKGEDPPLVCAIYQALAEELQSSSPLHPQKKYTN
jgi:uncharacterized protein